MALTYLNLQDLVLDFIDRSETDDRTRCKTFVNMAARDIWTSHPWRERRALAQIETEAPYSTGTIAVSENGSTVTGSGTTFPSVTASTAKFAKSYTDPGYLITSRDSATQLTLTNAYAESTETASAYVIYRDTYTLASDVDTVLAVRLLNSGYGGTLGWLTEKRMDDVVTVPGSAGVPRYYTPTENTSAGLRTLRVWPVPDDTYRLQYRYLKTYTEMSADGDECVIPENRRDLIISRALVWAYKYIQEEEKAAAEYALYRAELKRHWAAEQDVSPKVGMVRRFDSWGRAGGNPLTIPLSDV